MAKDMKNKNLPNRKKLLNSNWTAIKPVSKEKHFTVTEVELSEKDPQVILSIVLTAVMTKTSYKIDYQELADELKWQQGWK
jgi:tryptophan-rich hypothetical protein